MHFGLGAATTVDEVRVEWSHGIVSVLEDVAADQTLTIAPGAMTFARGDCNANGTVDIGDAILSLGEVFGTTAARICLRAFDANADSVVDISDPIFTLQALFGGAVHPLHGECVYGDTPGTLPCSGGVACP